MTNADGSAADLTGWTVLAQVRTVASSPTVQAEFTPVITDNVITLELDPVDLDAGRYVWGCNYTKDGRTYPPFIGGPFSAAIPVPRPA